MNYSVYIHMYINANFILHVQMLFWISAFSHTKIQGLISHYSSGSQTVGRASPSRGKGGDCFIYIFIIYTFLGIKLTSRINV